MPFTFWACLGWFWAAIRAAHQAEASQGRLSLYVRLAGSKSEEPYTHIPEEFVGEVLSRPVGRMPSRPCDAQRGPHAWPLEYLILQTEAENPAGGLSDRLHAGVVKSDRVTGNDRHLGDIVSHGHSRSLQCFPLGLGRGPEAGIGGASLGDHRYRGRVISHGGRA